MSRRKGKPLERDAEGKEIFADPSLFRNAKGQFQKGVSGRSLAAPGGANKPPAKGDRVAMSKSFITDVQATWKKHGKKALETVATEDPTNFLRVMAKLVPQNVKVTHDHQHVLLDIVRGLSDYRKEPETLEVEPEDVRH